MVEPHAKNLRILRLLKQETNTAMGCTEPAAVALACAHAASLGSSEIDRISVKVSPNILKNGMGVGIPGTGMIGLGIAAALGSLIALPEKGLEVLSNVSPELLEQAKQMLKQVDIKLADTTEKIWIEACISSPTGSSTAIIYRRHNWLMHLEQDGKVLFHKDLNIETNTDLVTCKDLKVGDYYTFCQSVDFAELSTINLGNELNRKIAELGLEQSSGIAVGRTIMEQIRSGILGDDLHHYAMALTAAATDARMSGCSLPVISNSGSGNQGLSITLPIIAVAEKRHCDDDKLFRALALGHLVSVHIKNKIGVLSCLCGCLSAAAGAACGIVYLLDGDLRQIEYAIKNMIGNTAGMVCDGAKEGCSLKVATNTSAAVQSALLALGNLCVSGNDGIVTDDVDETIDNLAELVGTGMQNADKTILNIMINKHKKEV
ncbi:MAG: hypothetical protein CVU48_00700 [Candidatus Cloacimonetes bacterium HGW-Cloacimonetes-1]|jgi:L-cysteine desulfidase|nr:MAG: hypothetical protein CVU48_00700 [Candidatus Cloacimonetes bacterium HGW-Cloacimonetes-1]